MIAYEMLLFPNTCYLHLGNLYQRARGGHTGSGLPANRRSVATSLHFIRPTPSLGTACRRQATLLSLTSTRVQQPSPLPRTPLARTWRHP
eukprot:7173202-Pyramimonas_sp.AAC.1